MRVKKYVVQIVLILSMLFVVCANAKWPAVGSDVPGSSGDCLYNDTGNVGAGSCSDMAGGAPTTATYITQTANTPLSAEQSLGALTTGVLLNTVTGSTGVLTAYTAQSCTNQFVRGLSASVVPTCASVANTDIAAMTSAQLATIVSDETGTGVSVFNADPTLTGTVLLGNGNGTATLTAGILRGPAAIGTDVVGTVTTIGSAVGTGTGTIGTLLFSAPVAKAVSGGTVHTRVAAFTVGHGQAAHPGIAGFVTSSPAQPVTDEVTAESGTAALDSAHSFLGKTFVARNASVTTTDVTTLYVTDSAGGTNNTATNVWSLITGRAKFTSPVFAAALTAASGTPTSLCLNDTTKEVTVNAALTCTVSSRKQKKQITKYVGSALQVVSQLTARQFVYKDNVKRQRIGFVAEELYSVSPLLADGYVKGQPTSIDQNALIATLVKGMQEQQEMIATLKQRVDRLEQR